MRIMLALSVLFAVATLAQEPFTPGTTQIPELAWEERSDWINVKKDGAKGDGVADDTAAIQAAFERIKGGVIMGATIYFPPGTYRITKTIEPPETHPAGSHLAFTMIGHGRTTILKWDGEAKGRMFWTKHGMPQARFVGLTWDGQRKAAVGFEHSSIKYFETEVRHQHEAYFNFTEAGIRVGLNTTIATAETVYDNCLFVDCGTGTLLQSHNVLDHTFRNCEFRRCGTGIASLAGTNFYAMDCRFEQSQHTDIRSHGEAGSSVRRCTSQNSAQFVIHQSGVSP
ncbi:MAG TPA: glycosyl hydrolase family 28-related protein, partial [Planctomycetota bacterium]|nr:glycosyl hydrolase family 28-related protein [Planctomycetota bacterium]